MLLLGLLRLLFDEIGFMRGNELVIAAESIVTAKSNQVGVFLENAC
jgi:hypothetical protein